MGEARRRRELETHINAIRAEGQGVHRLDIFPLIEVVATLEHVMAGDRSPPALLVAGLARRFMAMRDTPKPAQCFCCNRPMPSRFAALVSLTPPRYPRERPAHETAA